jgi:hypothetical protein
MAQEQRDGEGLQGSGYRGRISLAGSGEIHHTTREVTRRCVHRVIDKEVDKVREKRNDTLFT